MELSSRNLGLGSKAKKYELRAQIESKRLTHKRSATSSANQYQ